MTKWTIIFVLILLILAFIFGMNFGSITGLSVEEIIINNTIIKEINVSPTPSFNMYTKAICERDSYDRRNKCTDIIFVECQGIEHAITDLPTGSVVFYDEWVDPRE